MVVLRAASVQNLANVISTVYTTFYIYVTHQTSHIPTLISFNDSAGRKECRQKGEREEGKAGMGQKGGEGGRKRGRGGNRERASERYEKKISLNTAIVQLSIYMRYNVFQGEVQNNIYED